MNGQFQHFLASLPCQAIPTQRVSSRPKGYFADTGFACYAQAISTPRALGSHPSWGAIFETAVAGEIRKACARLSARPNVYHWRSHGGAEVDIVLERDGVLYPMEVKGRTNPARQDARGIEAFHAAHAAKTCARGLVLAPVERSFPLTSAVWAMPWDAVETT